LILPLTFLVSCGQSFLPDIQDHEVLLEQVEFESKEFLAQELGNGSFLVFLINRVGADGSKPFSQISIENDRIGIDHVLNNDLNLEYADRFRNLGHPVQEITINGVSYLRIETEAAPSVIRDVLVRVFQVSPEDPIIVFGEVEDAT